MKRFVFLAFDVSTIGSLRVK